MKTILKEKKPITRKQLQDWLSEQTAYSLHKGSKRRFRRARVVVSGLADQYDSDLMDMSSMREENDNYRYVLVMIDVFSRKLWMRPLKTKSAKDVEKAFTQIFVDEGAPKPRRLRTDRGKEYTNATVHRYFDEMKVHLFFTGNETKANYAERVIKTMKKKIFRLFSQRGNKRYIDDLPALVDSYNKTWHSSIRMAPNDVTTTNEKEVWFEQYLPKETDKFSRRLAPYRFRVGDVVRVSFTRRALEREYDQRWSEELFRIYKRFRRQNLPMYKIEDFTADPLRGTFYESELQHARVKEDRLYVIEKVEKTRGRGAKKEAFVKWEGWPKKFNSWIPFSNIEDRKQ